MSYIFSSNANGYTFKKLDSMLINLPASDGAHMLVRQTIDNVPTYSLNIFLYTAESFLKTKIWVITYFISFISFSFN